MLNAEEVKNIMERRKNIEKQKSLRKVKKNNETEFHVVKIN